MSSGQIRVLLTVLCLFFAPTFLAGCDSESTENELDAKADQSVTDTTGDDTSTGDAADAAENDATDTAQTDTTPEDATPDAEEVVTPMSACAAPEVDGEAVYDAIVVGTFAGEASVTKDGNRVVVIVDTEMFEGEFDEGTNCIPAQDGLLFPLCFVTPDGLPSAPETLGATLVTGAGGKQLGIVGAHRRNVDRSCAPSGHYVLTREEVSTTADTEELKAVVTELEAEYLDFLQVYVTEKQTVGVIGADSPSQINPLAIEGSAIAKFTKENLIYTVDAETEWLITLEGEGSFDDQGAISLDYTMTIQGVGTANDGVSIEQVGTATGDRL